MSKILIRIAVALMTTMLLLGGAYCYWTTTPLFALQGAALAVRAHDLVAFEKYVDSQKLVDSAINDVITIPIENMPGLSDIGKRVAIAAIGVSVGPAEKTLLRQIESYVSGSSSPGSSAIPSPYRLVSYNSSADLGSVLKGTQQDVNAEFDKFRKTAYERMQNWAANHQQGLVGRIFTMAKNPKQADVSRLLIEYGLVPENIRGLAYCNTTDDGTGENCKIGLKLMSPKVGHEILVEIELKKSSGTWQIVRLSNLEQLINEVDPSYAGDFQALIQSSVRGIDARSVNKEVGAMTKRITESDAVKSFLRKLNGGRRGSR